jgi:hypothetical protein
MSKIVESVFDKNVQQEIIDLLQDRRFSQVEIVAVHPIAYDGHWTSAIQDKVYEVSYQSERYIKPWDRREIGMRRAQVGRLRRSGLMGQLNDWEDGPVQVVIDLPTEDSELSDLESIPF